MKRRYKVLFGLHIMNHPETGEEVTAGPGSIVDTETDLLQFNGRGMTPKFELIDDHNELVDENAQLRARIAELEVLLKGSEVEA